MNRNSTKLTAREFMARAAEKVDAHKGEASAIGGVFKFVLAGDGGGTFLIDLGADPSVRETDGDAQCVLRMAARDFVRLVEGAANPKLLVLSGKLKIEGDKSLALKLSNFTRLLRA
ncbi:MAG: SCP2 sterol-binding domain-containing protein [Dehalococcoidia bacterium]